ncbi:MAG: GntR family transcriptional regulator [Acidimicrobiales bacterium]
MRKRATDGPSPAPEPVPMLAHDRVLLALRRGITSGYLVGGTRLVQPRIAEALGVSTTPVREALRQLAAEGLVQMDVHGGAVVHELSRSELVEVYELRRLLEPIAVERAAKEATETSLVAAVELVTAMQRVTGPSAWSEINAEFHSVIEQAAGGSRLASILSQLHALSSLYVTHSLLSEPDRIRLGNAEHREILEAVIDRDTDAAVDAVLRHLDGTLRALLEVRELDVTLPPEHTGRWWGD